MESGTMGSGKAETGEVDSGKVEPGKVVMIKMATSTKQATVPINGTNKITEK